MNSRGSLFELEDFSDFSETLIHLSIHYFELDLFKQYIEDVDALMTTPKDVKVEENSESIPMALLPVLTNQL